MKKGLFFLLSFLTLCQAVQAAPLKVVMITQIAEHPALDAVREGVRDFLRKAGYKDTDLEIVHESAQGSPTIAAQIAQKFVGASPDVIVAISTPSAQTVARAVRGRVPVVFAALTNPVEAKLLKDPNHPKGNITGVTDRAPFERQLAFIKKLIPSLKTLGLLHNPGEANSVSSLKEVEKAAKALDIVVLPQALNRTADVGPGMQALVGKVEAVFIANDNTVASGLEAAIKIATDPNNMTPLFAADIMLVERGLVGMIGFDYTDQGRQAGAMVARLLEGERADQIPVENPQTLRQYVNISASQKMGVTIPDDVLKASHQVFGAHPQTDTQP